MSGQSMPTDNAVTRALRDSLHEIDTKLALLAESNARLEKQVIGNGRMGLADKVNELEDLVERISEIQMRHLKDDREEITRRRERDETRREEAQELAKENRQFKRNLIMAALGVVLTNIGAWVVFYMSNLSH